MAQERGVVLDHLSAIQKRQVHEEWKREASENAAAASRLSDAEISRRLGREPPPKERMAEARAKAREPRR